MSFRRPPSDVERMTSLRVGNLPFKAHSEVNFIYIRLFLSSLPQTRKNYPLLPLFRIFIVKIKNIVFQDLLPLFEKYGDVGDVYIPLERGSGRSRGFAFVRFYDKRDAEVKKRKKVNFIDRPYWIIKIIDITFYCLDSARAKKSNIMFSIHL